MGSCGGGNVVFLQDLPEGHLYLCKYVVGIWYIVISIVLHTSCPGSIVQ